MLALGRIKRFLNGGKAERNSPIVSARQQTAFWSVEGIRTPRDPCLLSKLAAMPLLYLVKMLIEYVKHRLNCLFVDLEQAF